MYVVADVREKDDYDICHIRGSVHYPLAMLTRSSNEFIPVIRAMSARDFTWDFFEQPTISQQLLCYAAHELRRAGRRVLHRRPRGPSLRRPRSGLAYRNKPRTYIVLYSNDDSLALRAAEILYSQVGIKHRPRGIS